MDYAEADSQIEDNLRLIKLLQEENNSLRRHASCRFNPEPPWIETPDAVGVAAPTPSSRNRLGDRLDLSDPHLSVKTKVRLFKEQQFSVTDTHQGKERIRVLIPGVCSSCGQEFWRATFAPGARFMAKHGTRCNVCLEAAKPPKRLPEPRPCDWCSETFHPQRSDAQFCRTACRVAHHRHLKRSAS